MSPRTLRALLVLASTASLLALAAACGSSSTGGGNDDDENNDAPFNNSVNNSVNNSENNSTANNSTANNSTNNGTNNNTTPGACAANTTYTGQVFASDQPTSPNGGVAVTTPWEATYDAGIGAVLDLVPSSTEDGMNKAVVDLGVTEATVIATYFVSEGQPVPRANREFWIADGNGAIKVFFPADPTTFHAPFNVKVGQKINLRATELTNFGGLPEITGVAPEAWELVSEGNEVFIDDRTGGEIDPTDVNMVIRATGTLSAESTACGDPYKCYMFDFGGAAPVTLRTNSNLIVGGECVTYVGPVGVFGGAVQLNVLNFDWLRINQ